MTTNSSLIPSISFVERHNRTLIAALRAFDDTAWARQSYCPGWTAAHVIGHMTLGAHFYAHTVEHGCAGELSIPYGAKDVPEFKALRTTMMDDLVALPGAERVDRFETAADNLQIVFAAIEPADRDKPAFHPRCTTPVRYFPGQRFYELILHEWDIRNELGASLIPGWLDHGLDILKERLPFFYNQSPDPDLDGVFVFETTDPAHAWAVEIKNQKATYLPEAAPSPDVRLAAGGSDMIRLASGRADIPAKRASGEFSVTGDAAKADALIKILFNPF